VPELVICEMAPEAYEQLVAEILDAMDRQVEGVAPSNVGHGPTNHVSGKSGFAHQIDVSVRGDHDLVVVECKCWSSKVRPEAVLAFAARVIDIRAAHTNAPVAAVLQARMLTPKVSRK
jgi:hypothetical protein